MFCPNCRSEFRPGFTHCTKCDVALVDSLPEEAYGKKLTAMRPVLLRTFSNALEAAMVMELLRAQGISCLQKHREAGGILSISMGASIFGVELHVDELDLPAAQALLADWDARHLGAEPEDEAPEPETPYFKRRGAAMRVLLLLSALAAIFSLLYSAGLALYYFLSL